MSARILDDSALDDVIGGRMTPSEAYFVRCDRSTMTQASGGQGPNPTEFKMQVGNATNIGHRTGSGSGEDDRPIVILNPDGP